MNAKIRSTHLSRRAMVYIRQSSMAQVLENTESTTRQYALRQRAVDLGWRSEDVVVLDEDLGRSGASAEGRSGFARLAEEVAHGRVGGIVALEMSRLARSSADWQQLLRLCRLAEVVVIDGHGVYDPASADDRLLLDLKGTMSEAELQWLGLRLIGARRSRARRGELGFLPATGYVWTGERFEKDPDLSIQAAIQTVFDRFQVEPSTNAVVRWAKASGFEIPTRVYSRGGHNEVVWGVLGSSRLVFMLHNPLFAGVYFYGRAQTREVLAGGAAKVVRAPVADPTQWTARLLDQHAGYITWEQYLANGDKLRENHNRFGGRVQGAPREGLALLGGILVCGECGRKMQPTYGPTGTRRYHCPGERSVGGRLCWSLEGEPVDEAVEQLFLSTMIPTEIDLSLAVEAEASSQAASLANQWRLRIEKAEYEARKAERRYLAVDPDNRVVARTLESAWEERLRELERLKEELEGAREQKRVELSAADRERVRALARDLPLVWRAETTRPEERQAMLRLVVEGVCLTPIDVPTRATRVALQWASGAVTEIVVPRPGRGDAKRTSGATLDRLRSLVNEGMHDEEITDRLNDEGLLPAPGRPWTVSALSQARRRYKLVRRAPDRVRRANVGTGDRFPDGRYTVDGLARALSVGTAVVRGWIRRSLVRAELRESPRGGQSWRLTVDDADLERLRHVPVGRVAPAKPPLPDQLPGGRWTLPGLSRLYKVSIGMLRGAVRRGELVVEQATHGPYRHVACVVLDDGTAQWLQEAAARAHRRKPRRTRTHNDGGQAV